MSNLVESEGAAQLSLFDPLPAPARAPALREAVSALQDRYGDGSVDWGARGASDGGPPAPPGADGSAPARV